MKPRTKRVSTTLPTPFFSAVESLVKDGTFYSMPELVRTSLRELLVEKGVVVGREGEVS